MNIIESAATPQRVARLFRAIFLKSLYKLISTSRTNLAREILRRLTVSNPQFPFLQIANLSLSADLIDSSEANQIANHAVFPDWLIRELKRLSRRTEKVKDQRLKYDDAKLLCKQGQFSLKPPVGQSVSGTLTRNFASKIATLPEMFAYRGKRAKHFFNFSLDISWTSEGIYGANSNDSHRFILDFLDDVEPVHLSGPALLCFARGSSYYTHWLFDTLPKILALMECGAGLDQFDKFVFHDVSKNFHQEILGNLGIGPGRIISTKISGPFLETNEFTRVSAPRRSYSACSNVYGSIRSLFSINPGNRHSSRKIYISRARAGSRRILNEDELIEILEKFGYERVFLEDISIRQASQILAEAEAIIAPHGAGLANIVFAPAGAKVLEIFNAHLTPGYWVAANQLNLKYFAFEACAPDGDKCAPEALESMPVSARGAMDMFVPMMPFRNFLINEFHRS